MTTTTTILKNELPIAPKGMTDRRTRSLCHSIDTIKARNVLASREGHYRSCKDPRLSLNGPKNNERSDKPCLRNSSPHPQEGTVTNRVSVFTNEKFHLKKQCCPQFYCTAQKYLEALENVGYLSKSRSKAISAVNTFALEVQLQLTEK